VTEGKSNPDTAAGLTLAPLVSALIDAFIHGLHQRLPAAGFNDIRPAHCTGLFRVIDPQGTRPTELARRAGVTPQAMAEFVSYLEERGYLQRLPDPADGRGRIVKLTPRGRKAAEAASRAFAEIEAGWTGQLGEKRMQQLKAMLAELVGSDV
jgi:DNA-binding MarR family transcriptional regulator